MERYVGSLKDLEGNNEVKLEKILKQISRLKIILNYYEQGAKGFVYDMQYGELVPSQRTLNRFTSKNKNYFQDALIEVGGLTTLLLRIKQGKAFQESLKENVAKTRIN